MTLDVVVPTYNRSALLRRTIESLMRAPVPPGLDVTIYIVDNNCKDDTRQVVEEMQASASLPLLYLLETKQGLSHSRNGGIAAGNGELIGFIDDDEEIGDEWFSVIAREFKEASTSFIGGPYLANGEFTRPSWLPPGFNGILGVIEAKPRTLFTPSFPGNLNGGNAVLRRTAFEKVGLYDTRLGRSNKGLLSEEDAELYRRLLSAGLRGFHVPDLIIYHHIPASRLTRRYHRSWCYWRGVSQGVADRDLQQPVSYWLGVPRYRIRQAFRGLASLPRNLTSSGSGVAFGRELELWDFMGFVRGKFFTRVS